MDIDARKTVQDMESKGISLIKNKKWSEAFNYGDLNTHASLFKNVTGFDNYFNYLISHDDYNDIQRVGVHIQKSELRRAIHVGNNTFHNEATSVELNLISDVTQSIAP